MPAKKKPAKASPAITRNSCVRAIKAANKSGKITDQASQDLLKDINNRAEQAKAKYLGKKKDALENIAGELRMNDAMKAAIAKRNTLLSYKAHLTMMDYAKSGKFSTFGGALRKYMELTDIAGKDLGGRFTRKMLNHWEADGVADIAFQDFPELDFFKEVWAMGTPGAGRATNNDVAFKLAKGYFLVKDESITMKNMFGAYINRSPGHIIVQSTDSAKLRAAGKRGFFKATDVDQAESYKAWRQSLTDGGIRIDWEKTNDGLDSEEFLKGYHAVQYKGMYTDDVDSISETTAFRTIGSMTNRMSSKRVLWFADAESAFKYHQQWGERSLFESILGDMRNAGRQIAIIQRMGPNPRVALDNTVKRLLHEVEKSNAKDWKRQKTSLEARSLRWYYEELSGANSQSNRPGLSRFVDNLKSITIMGHSGNMLLPSLGGDQALMMSGSMYQGVKLADFFRMRFHTAKPMTPDRKASLNQSSFVAHAYIGNITRQWIYDIRPSLFVDKMMRWQMKLTGMTDWTNINERAASEIGSMVLGSNASKSWDELDVKYQDLLTRYSVSKHSWDVVRHKAYVVKGYGDSKVITQELAEDLTDQEVANILKGKGEKLTTANIARAKQDVASGIGAYITDFMHSSTGRPTLSFRAWKSMGISRGNPIREAMELFAIFKSFPTMAFVRAIESAKQHYVPRNGMSFGKWMGSNTHGMMWMSSYVAMTYLAGVLAQSLGDIVMGRQPLPLFDEDGKPILKTVFRHLSRGGGAGILGDLLFSEYDRNTRDIFDAMAGPFWGQATNASRLYTMGAKGLIGDDAAQEKLGYYSFKNLERNLPFINLFWIKPLYDQMIGWQLKEALSPGMLRRMEQSAARENSQEYWLKPTEVGSMDFNDAAGKIANLMESAGNMRPWDLIAGD